MLLRSISDTWVRRGPNACMLMFRYHLLHTLILPHSENVPQAYTGFCTDDYILNFEITGTIPMYSQTLCMIKIFFGIFIHIDFCKTTMRPHNKRSTCVTLEDSACILGPSRCLAWFTFIFKLFHLCWQPNILVLDKNPLWIKAQPFLTTQFWGHESLSKLFHGCWDT